ncbi:MAG: hypothetical protein E3J72_07970 [Planctomycetota bacterium]|nr:MAG: hypothetical protein E3J72_07970 [Planctomycetota bacterium]
MSRDDLNSILAKKRSRWDRDPSTPERSGRLLRIVLGIGVSIIIAFALYVGKTTLWRAFLGHIIVFALVGIILLGVIVYWVIYGLFIVRPRRKPIEKAYILLNHDRIEESLELFSSVVKNSKEPKLIRVEACLGCTISSMLMEDMETAQKWRNRAFRINAQMADEIYREFAVELNMALEEPGEAGMISTEKEFGFKSDDV